MHMAVVGLLAVVFGYISINGPFIHNACKTTGLGGLQNQKPPEVDSKIAGEELRILSS